MLQETEIADQNIECIPKTSTSPESFACRICSFRSHLRYNTRRHIKIDHPDKMRPVPNIHPVSEFYKLGAVGAVENFATGQVSPGAQSSSSSLASPPSGSQLFFPDPDPSKRRLPHPQHMLNAADKYIDTETESERLVSGEFKTAKKFHCQLCTEKLIRKCTRTSLEEIREHIIQYHAAVLLSKERKSASPDKKRVKMDRGIVSRRIAHSGRATTLMPTFQPAVAKPVRRARSPGPEPVQFTAAKPPSEPSSKKVEFAKKSANAVPKSPSNASLPATFKKAAPVVVSPPLMSRMNGPTSRKRSVLSDLEEDAPPSPKKKSDDASSSASSSSFAPVALPAVIAAQNASSKKADASPLASVIKLSALTPSAPVMQPSPLSAPASVIQSEPVSPPASVAVVVQSRAEPQLDANAGSRITVVCSPRLPTSTSKKLKRGGSSSALMVREAGSEGTASPQPVSENERVFRQESAKATAEKPYRPKTPSPARPLATEVSNAKVIPFPLPSASTSNANETAGLDSGSVYQDPPGETVSSEPSELPSNFQPPCNPDLLQPMGKSGKYVCRECWYGPEQHAVIVEHILSLHEAKKEPLKDVEHAVAVSSKSPSIDPTDWLHEVASEISEQVAPIKRGRGRPRKDKSLNPPAKAPKVKRQATLKSSSSGASSQSSRAKKKFQGTREVKEVEWEYRTSEDEADWETDLPGFEFQRKDKVFMYQAAASSGMSISRLKAAFNMHHYQACQESKEWVDEYIKKGPVVFPDEEE